MSFSEAVGRGDARMVFFLCIEGIGWPASGVDTRTDTDGAIYYTADLGSSLSTYATNATLRPGLELPRSLSDQYNPRTGEYSVGNMMFQIIDHGDDLSTLFMPNVSASQSTTLSQELGYNDRDLLYLTDGTGWSNGDVAWVGNTEAVLLAGKTLVSGTEYSFTITRAYLGTPRGRTDDYLSGTKGLSWASGTKVENRTSTFYNRKVMLFAYWPDEGTTTDPTLLYRGEIRALSVNEDGFTWNISTVGSVLPSGRPKRQRPLPSIATTLSAEAYERQGSPYSVID